MEFKIYGIFCRTTWKVYYGKTELTVKKRLEMHESAYRGYLKEYNDYCTSYEVLKNGNYEIKLLEVCDDKLHMKIREGYYIKTFPCVNKNIPGRTDKEWYEDNKEKIKKQHKEWYEKNKEKRKAYREANKEHKYVYNKEYYEKNKEKILEQTNEYRKKNREKNKEYAKEYRIKNKEVLTEKYTCECGSTLIKQHKARHERTKKHQEFINKKK